VVVKLKVVGVKDDRRYDGRLCDAPPFGMENTDIDTGNSGYNYRFNGLAYSDLTDWFASY
jgi:hypothetical protein